eukprot:GHVP01046787.1.p1 GENE.GHVP01046787.1~~GHVP01046787.1.p1  ORF type:complete len:118 (-),score=18.21 GHVP01046787.1:208-537(-)
MENKVLLAVGLLLKREDPMFDELAFFAKPSTRLSFKRHSTGSATSKNSVKSVPTKNTHQKSFFWEKAVGFLVLATLVVPYCIPKSPLQSSYPADEDEVLYPYPKIQMNS